MLLASNKPAKRKILDFIGSAFLVSSATKKTGILTLVKMPVIQFN
jgi:hypothetical protein